MDELPSLSFPSPWRGEGGRPRGRYSALETDEMEDVSLMSEGEGSEDGEGGECVCVCVRKSRPTHCVEA